LSDTAQRTMLLKSIKIKEKDVISNASE